ncbi:MAG: neocarzinostatin apoprotein domain-containing protein [Acidimicrobiales bacterium]
MLAGIALLGTVLAIPMGSAYAAGGSNLPLTVTPSTGLTGGQTVQVSGTGYLDSSIGNVLECNDDPNQPTVNLPAPVGSKVSVSCNLVGYAHLVSTSSSGVLGGSFSVFQGTVGPPCGTGGVITTCPTDSNGNSAAADAALYPCPPTAAQQAIGDVCQLSYGDAGGDQSVNTTILFSGESPPGSTTTAPPAATTTTTKPAATTTTTRPAVTTATTTAGTTGTTQAPATSSSSSTSNTPLASTGPGPDLWIVALIGFIALYLGAVTLALVDRPRNLLRRLFHLRPVPAAAGASGGDAQRHLFGSAQGTAMAPAIPAVGTAHASSDRTAWTTANPDLGTHNPLTDGGAWRAGSSSWRGVPRGDARLAGPVAGRSVAPAPTAPVMPVAPVAPAAPIMPAAPVAPATTVMPAAPAAPVAPAAPQGLWLEGWDPGGSGPA